MRYIDTHAHLNLDAFANDVAAVAERCVVEQVRVINIGTTYASSERAVDLAETYEHCYAMIGVHPIYTALRNDEHTHDVAPERFTTEAFAPLLASGRVVGVGECGFDYWHTEPDSYAIQEEVFIEQIMFANKNNLPLMIHTRGPRPGEESPTGRSVYADVYDVLATYAKVPFNVHFYAGTIEEAERFFSIGGSVSFTGVITFARAYEEVVKAVPLQQLFAETDCPYVAPVPYRGQRCEPWMVRSVYERIAAIKGIEEDEVVERLRRNVMNRYGIRE